MSISVVIPVWNEVVGIAPTLRSLREAAVPVEVIVVDGGSTDGTVAVARALADQVIDSRPGRARQMNAGAAKASGEVLLFLHADTTLPADGLAAIRNWSRRGTPVWGRFDVRLTGRSRLLPVVAATMNLRSRLSGIATGDQAIFVTRAAWERVGGMPEIPIMEDIALSRRLRRLARPLCLRGSVITSGRRWDANGACRTIAVMWVMRLGYACGVPPERLARLYRRLRRG